MKNLFRKLGFGLGSMQLELDRPNFFLGERLLGRLEFELEQPTQGKQLQIQLKVSQRVTEPRTTTVYKEGRPHTETRDEEKTLELFSDVFTLDGAREYARGSYPFALRLPHQIEKAGPTSEFGKIVEVVSNLRHGKLTRRAPVVWELKAWLEIPWSASLKTKMALQVSDPPAGLHPGDLHEPPGFVRNFQAGAAPISAMPQVMPQAQAAPAPVPAPARKLPKFCDQCGARRPEHSALCVGCGRNWT